MKVMDGWLVCRRIMPSAERLSSKFDSSPRSFASRPAVQFSDNLSALDIILQNSSKPARVFFCFKTLRIISQSKRKKTFHGFFRVFLLNCQPAFSFSVTSFCKTYSFVFHALSLALINSVE